MKYIDLGLSSGTLWCDTNEEGFFTFDEAVSKYGDSMPTKEQWEELKNLCQWEWTDNGYKVTGHNNNSIVLPALGFCIYKGSVCGVGRFGYYLSSTPYDSDNVWYLDFHSSDKGVFYDCCYDGLSVRLVK